MAMINFIEQQVFAETSDSQPVLNRLEILPTAKWQVEVPDGDKVQISEKEGCLSVEFDVDINSTKFFGWESMNQKNLRLMLKEPIKLDKNAERIVFEAFGHEVKTWNSRQELVQIWPIVSDEKGELFFLIPQRYPHLNNGRTTWSRWMTPSFYCGEAGGATQEIYEAEGGDGNSWPDGQLSFVGVQLVIRKAKMGRKDGKIAIGNVESAGNRIPYEHPYLYADSIFKTKGEYTFAATIANNFQATPVREISNKISFDPASLASGRRRVEIPLGPDDNYWVSYQILDPAMKIIAAEKLRCQAYDNPDKTALKQVDSQTPPPIGYMRINPDRREGFVYDGEGPMTVVVRIFPKDVKAPHLEWKLRQYAFDVAIEKGSIDLSDDGKAFQDIKLQFQGEPGRDAYRLVLDLKDKGKLIDRQMVTLGRTSDLTKQHDTRKGMLLDRNYVKKSPFIHYSFVTLSTDKPKSEEDVLDRFIKTIESASPITRYWTYKLDPASIEILPGVYDLHLLDRMADASADRGIALTIMIAHIESEAPYEWLKYSPQRNYDDLEIFEHHYGGYALTDARVLKSWHDSIKAIFSRYRPHRGFQGFYLLQPAGEFTVEDKPWEGIISGYEKPTQESFRNYLRQDLGLDLEQLNARWKTDFKSWDEVLPPRPDFRLGQMPDLRMSWVDFNNFKFKLDNEGWFPDAVDRIRSYAPDHVIITYGGTRAWEKLMGKVDYFHNGGNHFLKDEGLLTDAWDKGKTGWITEPHHPQYWAAYGDPAERGWILDWSVYVMTAQAGGGGANLHAYFHPKFRSIRPLIGAIGAYDRVMKYKPILDELQTIKLVGLKPEIAVLQDPLSMACKHRTTFSSRFDDLRRWFELLKADAIPFEDLRKDHLGQYKLLLPNVLDEVMSENNIELLNQLVRENGAKMIISAISGKYCPQKPGEEFALLKQLGINPPTGDYSLTESGISAEMNDDGPLFGKGAKIPFFTLGEMRNCYQGDQVKVRENFWSWPFRWLPQTNYFGYYKDNKTTNGKVLARFPSGGVALSLHDVGKGQVIVFWGIPNFKPELMKGMMSRAAEWANINVPGQGNPISKMIEGHSAANNRHFVLLYHETPGSYTQKFPNVPDGEWFIDDMVADQKYGTYTGAELRDHGLPLQYVDGCSPLKVIRLVSLQEMKTNATAPSWLKKYRQPEK